MNAPAGSVAHETLETSRNQAGFLWPTIIVSILAVWVVPMGSSLGLDESGNWWVIKDGFAAMLNRAAIWSGGQSVLFNSIVMGARQIAGDSDFALRIPAVLMMLGTLVLIHRLGLRMGGPLAAGFSCLAFVTMREVVQVASVLRPFALGVLLATGAMFALIRWLDHGRFRDAAAYVALAALTPYANYLHASMFLVHAICVGMRIYRQQTPVKLFQAIAAWVACGLLLLPLLRQAIGLLGRRAQAQYLSPATLEQLMASIAPPLLCGAVVFAVCAYLLSGRGPTRLQPADSELMWLAAVWTVVPPLTLLALGRFAGIQVFAGRYYVVNAPGLALLAGMLFRMLNPPKIARMIALFLTALAINYYGFQEGFLRGLYDYRGAAQGVAAVAEPHTPVLIVSSYSESKYLPNVTDPLLSQALIAPALRYGMPGRLIPAPELLIGDAEDYLERIFTEILQHEKKFVLTGLLRAEYYRTWLVGRGKVAGFHLQSRNEYSGVLVMVFEKDGSGEDSSRGVRP